MRPRRRRPTQGAGASSAPMPRNARKIEFPYTFEKLGRVAKIKFWPNRGIFGTYFRFAGKPVRNSFKSFEAAYRYLDHEFTKLDSDVQNSTVAFPVRGDLQTYHELEVLLKERTGGEGTLREAVDYFLAHYETSKVQPRKVADCIDAFRAAELRRKVSPGHAKKTKSRLKNLGEKFGDRWIHSVSAGELEVWLQQFPNPKTCNHYRASAVSLFLYAQNVLQAIPESAKVAPQRIQPANTEKQTKVEIYTPQEMGMILLACVEHDVMLIPPIVLGSFDGLRPTEVHGEDARYEPLPWEDFDWPRKELHIKGQKVRGLSVRDLRIPDNAFLWLEPFCNLTGPVWPWRSCYNERVKRLIEGKAKLRTVYDGFRHSYASYRIRQLGGDLNRLAEEMGNSAREIINSYKRNVRDEDVAAWFTIRPPEDYAELVRAALADAR